MRYHCIHDYRFRCDCGTPADNQAQRTTANSAGVRILCPLRRRCIQGSPEAHGEHGGKTWFCAIRRPSKTIARVGEKMKRTIQPPDRRFWSKVNISTSCWNWIGCLNNKGYGEFRVWKTWSEYAHRFSWALHFGPIPNGLKVLHRCDNPRCVRPDHLFLGTQADNVADMLAKGRESHDHGQKGGISSSRQTYR